MVSFSIYLLRQGYAASDITILVMYTGQLFETHRLIREIAEGKKSGPTWRSHGMDCAEETSLNIDHPPNSNAKEVRVCSVDNFQGEENQIILLSLVRSNKEKNIGFLTEMNRLCVSLSRAKIGIFIRNLKYISN